MNPTPTKGPNPYHQSETYSSADVQRFESESLPPDHPEVRARVRKGRPGEMDASEQKGSGEEK